MANNVNFIGFSFYINPQVEFEGVQTTQNIVNHFDLASDLIGLPRLEGESNIDFKKRIMDVEVHPSGGTYEGVINGLSRDLGFLREKTIKIELLLNSAGEPIASNPRVDILSNKVILYHDYRPDGTAEIDNTIAIYKPTDTGYFLDDLVAEINTSSYFSASIYSGIRPNMHSTCLLEGNTTLVVSNDPISTGPITYLSSDMIIDESVVFNETNVFKEEVLSTPAADGEYMIDSINGYIYHYSIPSGYFAVSYHSALFPYEVDSSPIKIYTLQDDDFQEELFEQKVLDSGESINALPNKEGSEIYHQLFSETEVFWGE